MPIAVGIRLARYVAGVDQMAEIAEAADALGYESIWLPDRLMTPLDFVEMFDADHAVMDPPLTLHEPMYDTHAYFCFLAGRTRHLRFGTAVYQAALRHPFVTARSIQTLDIVSKGRCEIGIGAGWVRSEYDATGIDWRTRGRRLDECIEICRLLWSQESAEFHGEFYDFPPMVLTPPMYTHPHPNIHAGGTGIRSLRRAARLDGWIGRDYTTETVRYYVDTLRGLREENGRGDEPFQITVRPLVEDIVDLESWEKAGVTRLYVKPWGDYADHEDPITTMERFAKSRGLEPRAESGP